MTGAAHPVIDLNRDPATGLTTEQEAAAAAGSGPVRVVAAAGTGKTAVICRRFIRLVESGVPPAEILVMTFTERAAAEMRERVLADLARRGRLGATVNVLTFHAFCLSWLRERAGLAGLPRDFKLLSAPEAWARYRRLAIDLLPLAYPLIDRVDQLAAWLQRLHGRLRQELIDVEGARAGLAARALAPGTAPEESGRLMITVSAIDLLIAERGRARAAGLLDFDDLVVETVAALRAGAPSPFRWVMVDEYQDTNVAQEELSALLAGPAGNLLVVGDDDQAIYRFRGASPRAMERFGERHPGSATLTLGLNQRCSGRIVAAARGLIESAPGRLPKVLAARRPPGAPVRILRCATGDQEAAEIARQAARLLGRGVAAGRIGILVRAQAFAAGIAAQLERRHLPYQVWERRSLLSAPEVRDLIALLRLVHDPEDVLAGARLAMRRLPEPAALALLPLLAAPPEGASMEAVLAAEPGLRIYVEAATQARDSIQARSLDDLLFTLMEKTRHLEWCVREGGSDPAALADCVTRFQELVEIHQEHQGGSLGELLDLLEQAMESPDAELAIRPLPAPDRIQVLTIHQAKGLEFDAVFVPCLVERRLPQPDRRRDPLEAWADVESLAQSARPEEPADPHLDEERRLLYVAMTRARRWLFLSWADHYEGGFRWRRSRFLAEIEARAGEAVAVHQEVGPAAGPEVPPEPVAAPPPALIPTAPPDRLRLSYTGASVYRECPRQYAFRYLGGIRTEPSPEARAGDFAHRVLRRLGELAIAGEDDLGLDHLRAAVETENRLRPAVDGEEAAYRAVTARRLETWLASRPGGFGRPVEVESRFEVEIGGVGLVGYIDRIDAAGPGLALITDYKNGRPLRPADLRRDLQLAMYALAVQDRYGPDPVLRLEYLRDATHVDLVASRDLLERAAGILSEVAAAIGAGRFEPAPAAARCRNCGYRLACPQGL